MVDPKKQWKVLYGTYVRITPKNNLIFFHWDGKKLLLQMSKNKWDDITSFGLSVFKKDNDDFIFIG